MARRGLFGRIADVFKDIADSFSSERPRRAAKEEARARRFVRRRQGSAKDAEAYAKRARRKEAEARARRDAAKQRKKEPKPKKYESAFQKAKREREKAERAARAARDRQKARERDPYLSSWNGESGAPGGYLSHRDFFDQLVEPLDLDPEEKLDLWQDYLRYMTHSNQGYKLSDISNPWWSISGIHPNDFDWHGWRDAMGYPHGNRKG